MTNQEEIIEYFVDFIIIQRKKLKMIFSSTDDDQTISEKINLLNAKNHLLTTAKIPPKGFELIEDFIQNTLSNIDDPQNLITGQVWRALILLHSLSNPDLLITNDHLEKLSSRLLNDSLSSSSIALTVLELVSHSHSFSPSFWYSILQREYSSELYLLSTRISFLFNKPEMADTDKFIQLLKVNLSSFKSNIRLLTLYILSAFLSDQKHLIFHCLSCEQSPLNVYEYRSKVIHLQKLSVDFILLNNNSSSFHLAMYYLLGLLSTNFTPLWTITTELLGSYGKKAIEYIGHGYFWSILNDKFRLIKEQTEENSSEQMDHDEITKEYLAHDDETTESIDRFDSISYQFISNLDLFPSRM